jgi:hypothetical protein
MAPPVRILALSASEISERAQEYFESRIGTRKIFPKNGEPYEEEYVKPPTFTGLARAFDISRHTLWRALHRRDDLPEDLHLALARACDELAEMVEEALYNRETHNGARFSLEVNHRHGREDEGSGEAGGFMQTIMPPGGSHEPIAIPKWGDDDE